MSRRFFRLLVFVPLLAVAAVPLGVNTGSAPTVSARALDYSSMTQLQRRLLSGVAAMQLAPRVSVSTGSGARIGVGASLLPGDAGVNPETAPTEGPASFSSGEETGDGSRSHYYPTEDDGCPTSIGTNVKVNQECLNLTDADLQGRGQAHNETSVAQDPNRPGHVLASDNDYRRGDGSCYGAFSLDKGANWADSTVPTSFTRGRVSNVVDFGSSREYWGGGGDTSVAFDTKGNAYLSCQVFNRGRPTSNNKDTSSALLVLRSTHNAGASWNFPGRYARVSNDTTGAGISPFLDKQLLTVDNHPGSPFQDRVYVSWTEFAADGTAFIYSTYSKDYGEHFSAPRLTSLSSPLCGGDCNGNQFSQPFTAPDGTLYITYANFNNAVRGQDNRNQILMVKSTDGGNTFTGPVKVADYYDLPDCVTYTGQDAGRACVPEKGPTSNSYFRATNYPSGAVNPTNPSQVAITFGSYINRHSNEANGCVPAGFDPFFGDNRYTGVKTPGACNNDILVSVSNNAGASFTGTTTDPRALTSVNQAPGQATTDQWFQWATFNKEGKLAVSYYDRQYGNDETTGFSDFSISGSTDLVHFGTKRVSTSSMPPPTQFGGVFWGDYTGLSAIDDAIPAWSDTRFPELFLCPGTATGPGSPPQVCEGSASNAPRANTQVIMSARVQIPTGGEGDDGGDHGGGGDGG